MQRNHVLTTLFTKSIFKNKNDDTLTITTFIYGLLLDICFAIFTFFLLNNELFHLRPWHLCCRATRGGTYERSRATHILRLVAHAREKAFHESASLDISQYWRHFPFLLTVFVFV